MSAGGRKSKRPKAGAIKKSAARQRAAQGVSLTDALAEAAWSEADAALAQALADYDEALNARKKSARKDALERLGEALSRAARKRGLGRIGELDERADYDAKAHDLNVAVAKTPKAVRVQARGVARGDEVLIRPRVTPIEKQRP